MQQSVQNNTALQRNIHNAERQQLSTRLSGSDSHKNLLIHLQYGTAYPRLKIFRHNGDRYKATYSIVEMFKHQLVLQQLCNKCCKYIQQM